MTGLRPAYPCAGCDKHACVHAPTHLCSDCQREGVSAVSSPYERAIKLVVNYTKVPRAQWEMVPRHPYARVADKIAKHLAGIGPRLTAHKNTGFRGPRGIVAERMPLPKA